MTVRVSEAAEAPAELPLLSLLALPALRQKSVSCLQHTGQLFAGSLGWEGEQ